MINSLTIYYLKHVQLIDPIVSRKPQSFHPGKAPAIRPTPANSAQGATLVVQAHSSLDVVQTALPMQLYLEKCLCTHGQTDRHTCRFDRQYRPGWKAWPKSGIHP